MNYHTWAIHLETLLYLHIYTYWQSIRSACFCFPITEINWSIMPQGIPANSCSAFWHISALSVNLYDINRIIKFVHWKFLFYVTIISIPFDTMPIYPQRINKFFLKYNFIGSLLTSMSICPKLMPLGMLMWTFPVQHWMTNHHQREH